jgi:hypothetical protein
LIFFDYEFFKLSSFTLFLCNCAGGELDAGGEEAWGVAISPEYAAKEIGGKFGRITF